jgi:hypothetical protein
MHDKECVLILDDIPKSFHEDRVMQQLIQQMMRKGVMPLQVSRFQRKDSMWYVVLRDAWETSQLVNHTFEIRSGSTVRCSIARRPIC